ncbi:TPA: hypothetical protein PPN70_000720 [Serratia rubidaea]|nr:hypothetical protein [Serratia rubidaea]HDJ1446630.1 hypothetical protein [Serratia rubidaea]HDJ1460977.1 hypothetical protein [Serratia rubidaea]HDJ2773816.1 hypothetical protein [Serratia rubidaea]
MKKLLVVSTCSIFLAGCMHLNDPRPKHFRASVTTVANQVCMMVQPEGDEKLISLTINEVGNDKNQLSKVYYDDALTIPADTCVPTFGYSFKAGKTYGFSAILESPAKLKRGVQPAARIYGVSFSLWENNGKLEANVLQ